MSHPDNASITVTLSHRDAVTLSHCVTVTLTLSYCVPVTLSHCVAVTLTLPYSVTVTLCHCHIVSLSHCHTVTIPHCYTLTMSVGLSLSRFHTALFLDPQGSACLVPPPLTAWSSVRRARRDGTSRSTARSRALHAPAPTPRGSEARGASTSAQVSRQPGLTSGNGRKQSRIRLWRSEFQTEHSEVDLKIRGWCAKWSHLNVDKHSPASQHRWRASLYKKWRNCG